MSVSFGVGDESAARDKEHPIRRLWAWVSSKDEEKIMSLSIKDKAPRSTGRLSQL
jgi:hypothetical protein